MPKKIIKNLEIIAYEKKISKICSEGAFPVTVPVENKSFPRGTQSEHHKKESPNESCSLLLTLARNVRTHIMLRQAGNLIAQTVLSTVINSVKPINVACKVTLETTAALQSVMHVAKDVTRRKMLPQHELNQLDPVTFKEALADIHNVRFSESRVLDGRQTAAKHADYINLPTKAELFGKFAKAKETVVAKVTPVDREDLERVPFTAASN